MKTQVYILAIIAVLTLSMCKKTENETQKTVAKVKEASCSMPLTAKDSSKYINHSIEVKGEIEVPLQITVDSLKTFPVKTITDFKVICQTGETKKK